MKVAIVDVDGGKFPNLALMKISAYHKSLGDDVEMINPLKRYDVCYQSKVFDDNISPDICYTPQAEEIYKGGTGYDVKSELPAEIEHIYPDYSLYGLHDNAYGFMSRGCPRGCEFCIVAEKEGRKSNKVSDLTEFWDGQKNITIMDPNLLACSDAVDILGQLAESKAWIDINQGMDCRLLSPQKIDMINKIKLKNIHFAWDRMEDSKAVLKGLEMYAGMATRKVNKTFGVVYVLVNHGTTIEEDLHRIYTIRDMGFDPYVMVYDKPNAPKDIRRLQRWVNARQIFMTTPRFEDYRR